MSLTEIKKKKNEAVTPELNPEEWSYFKLKDLFDIEKGKRLTTHDMIPGETPFIGAIEGNNGYRDFIGQEPIHSGGTITVSYNGSVAEAFYQPHSFWPSDDVNVLYPKFEMSKYSALFICTVIKNEKYRFNYGRKWKKKLMEEHQIKLPTDDSGNLDTTFMEEYIKTLPYSKHL